MQDEFADCMKLQHSLLTVHIHLLLVGSGLESELHWLFAQLLNFSGFIEVLQTNDGDMHVQCEM